jgi:hypothetical protein
LLVRRTRPLRPVSLNSISIKAERCYDRRAVTFSRPSACRLLALTALGLALGSCADKRTPTELVFVADAEGALDKVKFHIEGSSALGLKDPESTMGPTSPPPFFFGLVREHAPLEHITVTAEGWSHGVRVVQRTARVSFSPGEVLVVPLHLAKKCWDGAGVAPCGEDETCTERGYCESINMSEDELTPWNGKPPRMRHEDEDPSTGDGTDPGDGSDGPGGDGESDQDPDGHEPPPPPRDAGMVDDRDPDAGRSNQGMDAGHDAGHLDNGRDAGLDNGREDAGHPNGR